MKPIKALAIIAIVGSSSVLAEPVADSGLVSVAGGQTAKLNIVNVATDDKKCSFEMSFIDSTGLPVGSSLPVNNLAANQSQSLSVSPGSAKVMRAHIDFEPQLLANVSSADPLNGCFHLIPTFEVTDGTTTQVLDTRFYGMPSPEKGKRLEKVEICHKPGTPAEKTLEIPVAALKGHLGHGDTLGECNDH